jgi:short-subunit dehydrogenase
MTSTPMEISGSRVLLTGATGGLGGTIARSLHEGGARLVLTGRRADALEALASELSGAEVIECDLAQRQQLDLLLARSGDVDILVANAALPGTGTLEEFSAEEIDRALDVNLRAPILLAKQLAPKMAARRRSHIVFISSMGGKVPASRLSVYAATKYGLRGFAACLRQDLATHGVGVSVVFPGSVNDVGMWAESGAHTDAGTVTSSAVAAGIIRAIERNKGEVDVAPWSIRIAGVLAHLAPETFARVARRSGADKQTADLAKGLRHKR